MAPLSKPSMSVPIESSASLQALIRLSSASLPVGGYSYSQGLEAAVGHARVSDLRLLREWLSSALVLWPRSDALMWALCYQSLKGGQLDKLADLNRLHWASRDAAELRAETEQMGWSMIRLLFDINWLSDELEDCLRGLRPPTFLAAHASACWSQGIEMRAGLVSFCFSFVESQVQAAQKLLPIGQAAGQRLISDIQPRIDWCVEQTYLALEQGESALHTSAPMHTILCARHEFQYSRLFRS